MFVSLVAASFAAAQPNVGAATQDVLGAHLNYGRGCAACHAPHSGAWGNGANKSGDTVSGQAILWGQDTGNLYGQTITTAGGTVEVLPTAAEFVADTQPDVKGLLTCLSCHDGNWAEGAMMKDAVYETLPKTYGTYNVIPTLLGNDGDGAGNYLANHPVGLNAAVSCGAPWNWDCTETNGTISMTGTNSAKFVQNYGFFVSLSAYNNKAIVTCTSCHNQHIMNTVAVTTKNSGLTPNYYATMFFVIGPYNPASGTAGSNQTAQFCRQCHGGEANESNGQGQLGTIF
jgi:cytochrome c553